MLKTIEQSLIQGAFLPEGQAAAAIRPAVPLGISGDSSISRAEPNYMFALLKIEQDMERILAKEGRQLETEINSDLKRIESFNREKIELLRNHSEALKSQAQWNAWQAVTEYVAYSSSIALGAACFASGVGVAPALFLISSGVIGLVNRIGSDSGAWRWTASHITANQEKQQHLAQAADRALTATALALSILGTFSAYHAHVFEKIAMNALEVAMRTLNTSVIALQLTEKAAETYHHSRSLEIRAVMKKCDNQLNTLRTEISMDTAEIQKMFKLSEEIAKVVKTAITSQNQ